MCIAPIDVPACCGVPRIAIGGRALDQVSLPASRDAQGHTLTRASFPAFRHRHQWRGDLLTIRSPAATIAALLASGALPAVGHGATEVELDGQALGRFALDGIDLSGHEGGDTVVRVRLRRSDGGVLT